MSEMPSAHSAWIGCNVPMDKTLWDEATELGWQLDRMGRILPSPDILIAACALGAGVPVLARDSHFNAIPGLSVIEFTLD